MLHHRVDVISGNARVVEIDNHPGIKPKHARGVGDITSDGARFHTGLNQLDHFRQRTTRLDIGRQRAIGGRRAGWGLRRTDISGNRHDQRNEKSFGVKLSFHKEMVVRERQ